MTQFDRLFQAVEPTVLCYPANRSKKSKRKQNLFVSREFERIIDTFIYCKHEDQEMVLARLRVDTPLELVYLLCQ